MTERTGRFEVCSSFAAKLQVAVSPTLFALYVQFIVERWVPMLYAHAPPPRPPESPEERLARRLWELRSDAGLTQKILARQVGVSHQSIARYESGELTISALRLCQVARVLNLNVITFFEG